MDETLRPSRDLLGFNSQVKGITIVFFFADSVVFRCKKGMDPGLKIHPSLFGAFKNEVAEHQLIKIFVTMGSKNYSYDLIDSATHEVVGRITKIRGGSKANGAFFKNHTR